MPKNIQKKALFITHKNNHIYQSIMRYRDHKGGLRESLNTIRNVYRKKELVDHLENLHNQEVLEIKFKRLGLDDRTSCDSYYVSVRFKGSKAFNIVGISDSNKFEKQ